MTRVSTDLDPEDWGLLDMYAENEGITRPEAVKRAVKALLDDYRSNITGITQMGGLHPHLSGKPPRYEEASSGVKGDRAWRCRECDVLVANRYDHDATAHGGQRVEERGR